MKNGGGHFELESGGHFELESGGHFELELRISLEFAYKY